MISAMIPAVMARDLVSQMESDPDCHPMSNIAYIAEQLKPALASKKEVCG